MKPCDVHRPPQWGAQSVLPGMGVCGHQRLCAWTTVVSRAEAGSARERSTSMTDMITIVGSLGEDPRSITTSTGSPMVVFSLATQERRFDSATNQWVDGATNWYKVQAHRHLAAHASDSLHKGERVIVTGKVRLRGWDNGTKSGTDVESVADAIGHDLLFGTTVYTKRKGRSQSDADAVPDAPAPAEEEWSLPPGVDSEAVRVDDRERVPMDSAVY